MEEFYFLFIITPMNYACFTNGLKVDKLYIDPKY